jgi:hypothetical protein
MASTRSSRASATRIVVLAVSRDRRPVGRVFDDPHMAGYPRDELGDRSRVNLPGELRSSQHGLEFAEQQRASHDLDAVVDERSHHDVGRAAATANERGDEYAWVDDDADHAAPRSRRAAWSSS